LKLEHTLRDIAQRLSQLERHFAVVGGLACSARGEVRFTRDIDLAVAVRDDNDAEHLLFHLQQEGYVVVATVEHEARQRLATARLKAPSGVICDLIFATCGIEPEIVESAEDLELFEQLHLSTAQPEALIAMKVLSATPSRSRDLEDIRAIRRATPQLNEALVCTLLQTISSRGYDRGQDLLAKWQSLKT
jgi:hypothetical protein